MYCNVRRFFFFFSVRLLKELTVTRLCPTVKQYTQLDSIQKKKKNQEKEEKMYTTFNGVLKNCNHQMNKSFVFK